MAVSTIDALYNGTSEKLTTSATGITVTGTVAATAYTGDGSALTGTGSPSIVDNGNATAMTIYGSENININNSVEVGNTVTSQKYKLNDGSSFAGGMFVEKDVTGSGSSNDISIFADGITNGGNIHFMSGGSANVRLTVDSSGRVTKPNQPAFYVLKGTTQEPIGPTINTTYNISFTDEQYDEGNNFANSTFTAPVTGKYLLMAQVQMVYAETQGNAYIFTLVTSNRTFGQNVSQKFSSTPTFSTLFAKNVVDMDAGDTATVKLRYYSVVGSNPDVPSGYNDVTFFSGYLLG